MPSVASNAHTLAEEIDHELRARGSSVRATKERAYLKSELVHYGVGLPETRAVVREALRTAELEHDDVVALAAALWDSVGNIVDVGAPGTFDLDALSLAGTHVGARRSSGR